MVVMRDSFIRSFIHVYRDRQGRSGCREGSSTQQTQSQTDADRRRRTARQRLRRDACNARHAVSLCRARWCREQTKPRRQASAAWPSRVRGPCARLCGPVPMRPSPSVRASIWISFVDASAILERSASMNNYGRPRTVVLAAFTRPRLNPPTAMFGPLSQSAPA